MLLKNQVNWTQQFEESETDRLASSSVGSLGANLGDEDPGLLRNRLGGGQPLLKRESVIGLVDLVGKDGDCTRRP